MDNDDLIRAATDEDGVKKKTYLWIKTKVFHMAFSKLGENEVEIQQQTSRTRS